MKMKPGSSGGEASVRPGGKCEKVQGCHADSLCRKINSLRCMLCSARLRGLPRAMRGVHMHVCMQAFTLGSNALFCKGVLCHCWTLEELFDTPQTIRQEVES